MHAFVRGPLICGTHLVVRRPDIGQTCRLALLVSLRAVLVRLDLWRRSCRVEMCCGGVEPGDGLRHGREYARGGLDGQPDCGIGDVLGCRIRVDRDCVQRVLQLHPEPARLLTDRLRRVEYRCGYDGFQQARNVITELPGTLDGLSYGVSTPARTLVEAFWPGALTVVVRHAPSLAWDIGDAEGKVALRMPLHPLALELLRTTGPMAVTSANRSGLPVPATAVEAQDQLGDAVSVYLDAGPSADGLPSTIVDASGEVPVLLGPGAIGVDVLREVCPDLVVPDQP